jgi:hypothetical protein
MAASGRYFKLEYLSLKYIGIGVRCWRFATRGNAHVEGNIFDGDGGTQTLDFSSERYGAFVQGAFKF